MESVIEVRILDGEPDLKMERIMISKFLKSLFGKSGRRKLNEEKELAELKKYFATIAEFQAKAKNKQ